MDPVAGLTLYVFAVVAFAVGVVALAVYRWQRKRRRADEMATWAMTRGMSYSAKGDLSPLGFHLFTRGDGRGWDNVVHGTWEGADVQVADYWYYDESSNGEGRRSRTYRHFSVAAVRIDARVPAVRIERETPWSRLTDHVGFRDIEFESEEFNRRFEVRSGDREFAFKLVDGRMIDWLLGLEGKHCYEVNGSWLLAYCSRLASSEVMSLLYSAKAFRERIPRLVWVDYGKGLQ